MRFKISFLTDNGIKYFRTMTLNKTYQYILKQNVNPDLNDVNDILRNMEIGLPTIFIVDHNSEYSLYIIRVK